MVSFSAARRKLVSLPYDLPDLPPGVFALYAPSQALGRRAAVQAKDDASRRPVPSHRKLFGLLTGTVRDAEYCARKEGAAWLADMARGICCPRDEGGFLWAHESCGEWRRVGPDEPLADTSYLYQAPPRMRVGLQKMYRRTVTVSSPKHGGAQSLVLRLVARDGECWVTQDTHNVAASRILPKNMPLADKQRVLADFSLPGDAAATPIASAKDIRLTLFLTSALEHYFERFWFGFRWTGQDTYECHSFVDGSGYALTTEKELLAYPFGSCQLAHGLPISPPYPQAEDLPPAALFRWHYLQCVLKKFGHDDYLGVPNIRVPAADDYYDNCDYGYERAREFDWRTHMRRFLIRDCADS